MFSLNNSKTLQSTHTEYTFIHLQTVTHYKMANVNFLYDDIVHPLQNTINSCINSATDRRGYVLERRFAKFSEITQCDGHYAVQGHSRSPILVPIESSYRLPQRSSRRRAVSSYPTQSVHSRRYRVVECQSSAPQPEQDCHHVAGLETSS